jgi:hypothetical protein
LENPIEFHFEEHISGQVEVRTPLKHHGSQPHGRPGSASVESPFSSTHHHTHERALHPSLPDNDQPGAVSSIAFQGLVAFFGRFDVGVAGSDDAGLQGKNRSVGQAHVVESKPDFSPAGQAAWPAYVGYRRPNLASSGNGDRSGRQDFIGSPEICPVTISGRPGVERRVELEHELFSRAHDKVLSRRRDRLACRGS